MVPAPPQTQTFNSFQRPNKWEISNPQTTVSQRTPETPPKYYKLCGT